MATPPENKVTDTGAVSILEVLDNMEHYNVNTIYDKAPTLQWLMALASVSILFSIVRFSLLSLRPRNFPPGPRAWPFIGNVHHFASLKPFLQFTDLSSRYGDIVGLKAGPTNIVVLNSPEVCRELLEKRGAIYSGRPFGFIEREYVILDSQHFVFAPYDDYHRRCRSAMRILLGPTGLGRVAPLQDAAAAYFVKSLASTPAEIHNHLHNWGISVPLTAICGHRGAQKDPEMIASFYKNQKRWCEILTPGLAPPVEILPFLKYLPECLARWKRTARDIRRKQRQWFYMMLDTAKKELQRRSNDPQDTTSYFEPLMVTLLRQRQLEKGVFEDDQLAYLCGTIFDAAVDTTHSSALTFVKCLTAYPQVLKRAQAEIDDICGLNRPPGPQDMTKMRYLKACWLEVLRWRPATAVSLPRELDADDTFRGYRIPKGTIVLQNSWGISHDPDLFASPSVFNPDRFLDSAWGSTESVEVSRAEGRKISYGFGAGRRQCPGDIFAQNAFLVMAAKLVWAFDIVAKGELDMSIESGYDGGLVIGSEPFEVECKLRSQKHWKLITEQWEELRHWFN